MGLFSKKQKDFDEIRNENEDASLKRVSELFAQVANSTDNTPREGFKQALKQRILEARAKNFMKSVPFFKRRAFAMLAAGGTTAIVVLIISMLVIEPIINVVPVVYAQDNFTLTAETSDSLGVDAETTWLLESKTPISPDEIESLLQNSLDVPLSISAVDEFSVRVELEEALESDEVIQFVLDSEIELPDGTTKPRVYQWAFQAQSQFHVTTSVPGDQATDVPLSTGIEVTFSHDNVSEKAFEQAISIDPVVAGHVEKYRRSLVWVPEEALDTMTLYTVTISGDLSPDGSDETLGEDYVFEFETEAEESRYAYYYLYDYSVSTQPDEPASVGAYYNRNYADALSEAVFEVYAFSSGEDFGDALLSTYTQSWRRYLQPGDMVNTDNLSHVGDFEAILDEDADYGSNNLSMPVGLDEGYYFARLRVGDQELPLFIQSSTLAATVVKAEHQSLAWAHDLLTGQPISGAEISSLESDFTATTNGDGVAMFETPEGEESTYGGVYKVTYGSRTTYLKLDLTPSWYYNYGGFFQGWFQEVYDDNYWAYISTDRAVYLNDDTVNVFGMVEDRQTGEIPETVRVWIESGSYYYRTDTTGAILTETEVELSDEGTFTASLTLPGASANTYGASVRVAIGDDMIVLKHIGIAEYQKPVMSLDVHVDTEAVFTGDEVPFTLQGSYFDGTPAANQEVAYSTPSDRGITVQLDENGRYEGAFTADSYAYYFTNGLYRRQTLTAYILTPGSGEVTGSDNYYEFGSHFEINQEGEVSNEAGQVDVTVYGIDLSGIEDTTSHSLDEEAYRSGVLSGTDLAYTVTERWYEKEKTGTTYDYIRKETYETYRYSRQENSLEDGRLITDENGHASITYVPTRDDASYEVDITGAGEEDGYESSRWYRTPSARTTSYDDYSLHWDNPDKDDDTGVYPSYSIGDQVILDVVQNEEPFEMPEGSSFLYLQTQIGVQEYEVSDEATYSFTFEERDAPNVYAYGILFLDNGYVPIGYSSYASPISVDYQQEDQELVISIETDADTYAPGDEAQIDVMVTDTEGNPVEADVNISVVDEAYFALFGMDPDPLTEIYRSVTSGVYSIETSHKATLESELADGKGGGFGDPRTDFVDTAAFTTIHSNKKGKGSVTVQLADNVTSWRITAQGYDHDERQAGVEQKNISTTLPFFVRAAVQESYLDGDEPNIYVFSAGTEVGQGDEVEYLFEMESPEVSYSTTASFGDEVSFALPDLEEGSYEVYVAARSGEYSDTIQLPVEIINSRLTRPSVTTTLLGEEEIPEIDQDLALVSFVDAGIGQYYGRLMRYSWWFGDRADEVAARYGAQTLLRDVFDEEEDLSQVAMSTYQPYQLVRLLEHADVDLVLTSKIALLQDTPFDEVNMAQGLADLLDTENSENVLTAEERAWAYAGMAALGEIRLSDIQRLSEEELSGAERLISAVALFYAGDHEGARAIYRDLMMNDVQYELGMAYWNTDVKEDWAEYTSLLAILAAGLQEDGQDELYEYLVTQSWGQTLINVEEMAYLTQAIGNASTEDSVVEIYVNGRDQELELEKGRSRSWYLTQSQIDELNPVVVSGDVSMVVSTQVPLSLSEGVYDSISIDRTYLSVDGTEERTRFSPEEIVRVQITYKVDSDIPDGAYQITDILPSGLTPITSKSRYYNNDNYCVNYPYQADTDQKVSFTVYDGMYRHKGCAENTITYYARVMNSGTFETEPAIIRSLNDVSLFNYSTDDGEMTIGN